MSFEATAQCLVDYRLSDRGLLNIPKYTRGSRLRLEFCWIRKTYLGNNTIGFQIPYIIYYSNSTKCAVEMF